MGQQSRRCSTRSDARLAEIKTAPELEQWLLDWGELYAALEEEGARRYIAMTCHTDNPDAEKAYLEFVEKIEPELKPRQFQTGPDLSRASSDGKDFAKSAIESSIATRSSMSNCIAPENVPLETEEAQACGSNIKS